MPAKSKKPCAKPRCPNLTTEFYCPEHAHVKRQHAKEKDDVYDRNNRDPKITAFYKSQTWRNLRIYVMRRDHGLCQPCFRDQKITAAKIVHHKIEVKDDWEQRLVADNLEAVCQACHNRIHNHK